MGGIVAKTAVILLLALLVGMGLYHRYKPLPADLSYRGPERVLVDPYLLSDVTYRDAEGQDRYQQTIFDEVFRLIGQAQRLVVVDMFLYNGTGVASGHRSLAETLTGTLIARKQAVPGIAMVVITDPFNTLYGGARSPYLERLERGGVTVVETPLNRLRDSNPLWSAPWRLCCQWLGNSTHAGWLPNPFGGEKIPLRSLLALLNFKANHRKTLVVDEGEHLRGLVTSANPHDGSSRHHNTALSFAGPAAGDLLHSELAVVAMAGGKIDPLLLNIKSDKPADSATRGQIVTESQIRRAALDMIDGAEPGSALDLSMFYFSHRELVRAFIDAHRRGVEVRVLLDANHDAFGREKNGIPNRQVAWDLHRAGIPVRWCNTHGEQCHSKLLMRRDRDGGWQLLLGSANFTRRNLDDLNLETDIRAWSARPTALSRQVKDLFEHYWRGDIDGWRPLSLPYSAWSDESWLRYGLYRIMESTGMSTF